MLHYVVTLIDHLWEIFISAKWTECCCCGDFVWLCVWVWGCGRCVHAHVQWSSNAKLMMPKCLNYPLQIWHTCSQGQSVHDFLKHFRKGGVARVTWPLNFRILNANSSKTVKDMDFKLYMHLHRDSPDITPYKFFERGVDRVTLSINFSCCHWCKKCKNSPRNTQKL